MTAFFRERLKWLLFPGLNLHARLRWRFFAHVLGEAAPDEPRRVLDAGCGNGMLAYRSYQKGNRVLGISIKEDEVARCRRFFNEFLRIPQKRLTFRVHDLYEVEALGEVFDEIICSEVLEHLARDAEVVRSFARILKPAGVLHVCVPNAEHPDNRGRARAEHESGGHVRPGYTPESLRALLEPAGFRVAEIQGLGGPIRQWFNRRILRALEAQNEWAAVPLFGLGVALAAWDPPRPQTPYMLYARAVKASG